MSERAKILIFFITIIFAFAILLIVVLLSTSNKREPANEKTPDSFTEDKDPDNIITIGDPGFAEYAYVGITQDDTLRIYDEDGESIGINLERNEWQNLQTNDDPNVISVLGNRTNSNKDLALYFIDTARFGWYTDYSRQPTGILQYGWLNDETIYFHQGALRDEWFHKFEYPSQVEIEKIFRSNGQIVSINSDMNKILYNFTGDYRVYDLAGNNLWNMDSIVDQNDKVVSSIENPMFTKDQSKIVFTVKNNNGTSIYKVNSEEDRAVKLDLEFSNFEAVCAVSEDDIIGVRIDAQGDSEIVFVNVKDETIDLNVNVADETEEVVLTSFDCISADHVLFKTFKADGTALWYEYKQGELSLLSFLTNSKEVKLIK